VPVELTQASNRQNVTQPSNYANGLIKKLWMLDPQNELFASA